MTVYKTSVTLDHTTLRCDLCNSDDIAETVEGYVCRTCGVVQTIQKLQYDRPYKADVVQYARRLGDTQIGNKKEQIISPNSRALKRMSLYNKVRDNEKIVYAHAQREISRILSGLALGDHDTLKEKTLATFKEVRACFTPGSKYRNVGKLVAIILHMQFKVDGIPVQLEDLFDLSQLTRKEFNDFFMQVHIYYPQYINRDRMKYICTRFLEIANHFDLEMAFYFLSKKVLFRFWEGIKNTTDNVIAGLCASITALCDYPEEIKVNSICNLLDIRMSTIQLQVRKNIFERYHLTPFSTLVNSAELLKKFMIKIGVVDKEIPEIVSISEGEEDGIIHVQLGNALHVHNPLNEHYILENIAPNDTITYTYLEVFNQKHTKKKRTNKAKTDRVWFKVASEEYFLPKDPPEIIKV